MTVPQSVQVIARLPACLLACLLARLQGSLSNLDNQGAAVPRGAQRGVEGQRCAASNPAR